MFTFNSNNQLPVSDSCLNDDKLAEEKEDFPYFAISTRRENDYEGNLTTLEMNFSKLALNKFCRNNHSYTVVAKQSIDASTADQTIELKASEEEEVK